MTIHKAVCRTGSATAGLSMSGANAVACFQKHIEYNHMNVTEEQQVDFIQSYEKYLEIRDELQEDPEEGPSLPGLYSGPVRPQAGSSGRPGRSDDASVG